MRKAMTLIAVALLALALMWGCAAQEQPGPTPPPGDPAPGPEDTYPAAVREAMTTVKPMEVGVAVVVEGKTYAIVSFGEKPTGGYDASASGDVEEDRLVVTATLTTPKPDEAVTQEITYPQAVEVFDGVYQEVVFQTPDGQEFPQVVGLKGTLTAVDRSKNSNIIVTSLVAEDKGLRFAGIARVFEAVVGYELQNAEGQVLSEGFAMAAAGGPNWGYFEKEITGVPGDATRLVVFQPSAEDGSKLDVVQLDLTNP